MWAHYPILTCQRSCRFPKTPILPASGPLDAPLPLPRRLLICTSPPTLLQLILWALVLMGSLHCLHSSTPGLDHVGAFPFYSFVIYCISIIINHCSCSQGLHLGRHCLKNFIRIQFIFLNNPDARHHFDLCFTDDDSASEKLSNLSVAIRVSRYGQILNPGCLALESLGTETLNCLSCMAFITPPGTAPLPLFYSQLHPST